MVRRASAGQRSWDAHRSPATSVSGCLQLPHTWHGAAFAVCLCGFPLPASVSSHSPTTNGGAKWKLRSRNRDGPMNRPRRAPSLLHAGLQPTQAARNGKQAAVPDGGLMSRPLFSLQLLMYRCSRTAHQNSELVHRNKHEAKIKQEMGHRPGVLSLCSGGRYGSWKLWGTYVLHVGIKWANYLFIVLLLTVLLLTQCIFSANLSGECQHAS